MQINSRWLSGFVLAGLTSVTAARSAGADDVYVGGGSRIPQFASAAQPQIRLVQFGASSHYPFAQPSRAYRYPFNYPYYRFSPRHYPFGNGPYGPYNSNYGGYTGNAFDAGVYGNGPPRNGYQPQGDAPPLPDDPGPPPGAPRAAPRSRLSNGPNFADAPAAPDEGGPPADTREAPPAVRPPAPFVPPRPTNVVLRPLTSQEAQVLAETGGVPAGPPPTIPRDPQFYGEPVPYSGTSPFNPSYGGGRLYQWFPHAYFLNDMWFGSNRLLQGAGYYPLQNYSYFYGPPSGFGFYGPEYMPQYYNYSVRNYGPYYPGLGGVNNGAGFFQGGG
jgi:hypothetical protein